jgi:GTP cyclohydrolase IIa
VIQATLLQLDNYGPWTVTPEPRREMDLQSLQSRLYADVAAFVGARNGYAFYGRGDNVLAFTNGLDVEAHRTLQASIRNQFPVTASAGIGAGATPRAAVADATEALQAAGSAQDAERTEVLRGGPVEAPEPFHVAHFDVVDATGRYTDRRDAYETQLAFADGFWTLARHLYRVHEGLAFFVGGDNAIAVCPGLPDAAYREAVEHVAAESGTEWRVGVGEGSTARAAGADAKEALEACREREDAVCGAAPPTACD